MKIGISGLSVWSRKGDDERLEGRGAVYCLPLRSPEMGLEMEYG